MGVSSSAVSVPPSIDKIRNCVGTKPSGLLNVVGAIRTVVKVSSETKPLAFKGVLAVTSPPEDGGWFAMMKTLTGVAVAGPCVASLSSTVRLRRGVAPLVDGAK